MELAQSFVAQPLYKRLKLADWLYAVLLVVAAVQAWRLYNPYMDGYEQAILAGSAVGLVALGWFWKSWRWFFPLSATVALLGISLYHGELARGQSAFWLKFLLSSQSAIMWMCTLFFLATLVYWAGLLTRSAMLSRMGSGLTWAAAVMGAAGLFVRWYESYLIGSDVGHIPVSNLYEVFILFTLITALMYLYYEARFATRQAGAFVLLVISAAVGFILWYSFDRQAHEIQPLIPALQSWWMKIHVPANFVGYGAFAMSAMLGVAELLVLKGVLKDRLPSAEVLDEMMYKAISIGFLFFTIATILGAMWAADAWGGYWSWDPKETWALIVWLNYAAWLHIRLVKGWRGKPLAWWAVIGLLVTTFAFLGVNMYLTGLHSYGGL
ncbi:cytochrome C biogenesis protein [Aquitalea magnusonii]|uniref:c-type cytochrome biogenesis protein CcsB n=2 Tax=Chromobacteriaceae TaxID=1499392 RepID=UPI0005F79683|nr:MULTISPECIES: c-type cytochrome biogenesis protein CcsB [Aquitalea]KJV29972.1 cytochrome C biogenesis protein [Aquitalea magnusonii]NWK77603.1 c-type cytochrome biogenesis protein CcsB [Aquitalea sp. LB_tupeE]